jgi:biotin synthase
MNLEALLNKCLETGNLKREEIVYLLSLQDQGAIESLYRVADKVRELNCGSDVYIRGLIEFSNVCARNCYYCGLRRENKRVQRYRMTPEEIVETSIQIVRKGIGTVVLQSGEDPWFTADIMAGIIRDIKSHAECAITLCIGERTYDEYKLMKQAGADRYLLRHETANPELYRKLHPDMSFENRVRCLHDLKSLGYQVGAGSMVGLPGQTVEDMADDIIFLRDLEVDMAGIGPFIPHPNTPLGDQPGGTLEMTLKMVALARIVTRNAHLPATTAVGSIDPVGRTKALMVGANIVMPNFTPLKYRVNYEIYPNKQYTDSDPDSTYNSICKSIESIGRTIGKGMGHSLKLRA